MFSTSLSALMGASFAGLGALYVWPMFQVSKQTGSPARKLHIHVHRIGGYVLFALLPIPLLFVKVLIARYYKTYHSVLMPLGIGTRRVDIQAGPTFGFPE
jgi:hypothetical protein